MRAFSADSEGLIITDPALTGSGGRLEAILPRRVSSSRLFGEGVRKFEGILKNLKTQRKRFNFTAVSIC